MNKVMKNFKNLGNSIVIQSMNENVRPISETQNSKRRVFTRLFFISTKIKAKQIIDPPKEISEGFFTYKPQYRVICSQYYFFQINLILPNSSILCYLAELLLRF